MEYFNSSARLSVPAGGTNIVRVTPNVGVLEKITISVGSSSFVADMGVIITNNGMKLYPDTGSNTDGTFTNVNQYGVLLPLGNPLELLFGRKLSGPPHTIDFEFYNTGGSAVLVVIVVTTSQVPIPRPVVEKENAN